MFDSVAKVCVKRPVKDVEAEQSEKANAGGQEGRGRGEAGKV